MSVHTTSDSTSHYFTLHRAFSPLVLGNQDRDGDDDLSTQSILFSDVELPGAKGINCVSLLWIVLTITNTVLYFTK